MAIDRNGGNVAAEGPLIEVRGLKKHFPIRQGFLSVVQARAVDGISFTIDQGETLGLVGESGCGKSTVARVLTRLTEPTEGEILLNGCNIAQLRRGEMGRFRLTVQMIFQDPYSSLNPRMSAGDMVGEPLLIHRLIPRSQIRDRVAALFESVGLRPDQMKRFPHEFSGGQRQRIGIARALAVNPRLIIADEPVSALDVSIQAQAVNLMMDIQKEFDVSYLFISHDMAIIAQVSHRIAVMYLGLLVEVAEKTDLLTNPLHPYTKSLIDASPVPNPKLRRQHQLLLSGEPPSPIDPPEGCRFHRRCPLAENRCKTEIPVLREVMPNHFVACLLRTEEQHPPQ